MSQRSKSAQGNRQLLMSKLAKAQSQGSTQKKLTPSLYKLKQMEQSRNAQIAKTQKIPESKKSEVGGRRKSEAAGSKKSGGFQTPRVTQSHAQFLTSSKEKFYVQQSPGSTKYTNPHRRKPVDTIIHYAYPKTVNSTYKQEIIQGFKGQRFKGDCFVKEREPMLRNEHQMQMLPFSKTEFKPFKATPRERQVKLY